MRKAADYLLRLPRKKSLQIREGNFDEYSSLNFCAQALVGRRSGPDWGAAVPEGAGGLHRLFSAPCCSMKTRRAIPAAFLLPNPRHWLHNSSSAPAWRVHPLMP